MAILDKHADLKSGLHDNSYILIDQYNLMQSNRTAVPILPLATLNFQLLLRKVVIILHVYY